MSVLRHSSPMRSIRLPILVEKSIAFHGPGNPADPCASDLRAANHSRAGGQSQEALCVGGRGRGRGRTGDDAVEDLGLLRRAVLPAPHGPAQ